MRIIAGKAGGVRLRVPAALTRPTTDRVREAVFSSLGDRVLGARVLDLYAGSGALGLEALSRGARAVTFVDEQRGACDTVAENLRSTRLEGEPAEVLCQPVAAFLRCRFCAGGGGAEGVGEKSAALILADPPYARDATSAAEVENLLTGDALVAALKPDGVLVVETWARADFPKRAAERWAILHQRTYGATQISYLRMKTSTALMPEEAIQ